MENSKILTGMMKKNIKKHQNIAQNHTNYLI